MADRWPPVYDAEDLLATIGQLAGSLDGGRGVYSRGALSEGGLICQGDVVSFPSAFPVPLVDAEGSPGVFGDDVEYWLVIGNTCDFHRDLSDVETSQMVPLFGYNASAVRPDQMRALREYRPSRRFFLPSWQVRQDLNSDHSVWIAEFKWPVSVHKAALLDQATVHARLSREGWILLHACLVRFLCRDDGRFDP